MKIGDFSSTQIIKNALFFSCDLNQLYHPTGHFTCESFDIVYSKDQLTKTKFTPILLKEWFYLVKPNGYMVIDYRPSDTYNFQQLEDMMWWLWQGKYDIIYHGHKTDKKETINTILHDISSHEHTTTLDQTNMVPGCNGYLRLIAKKTVSTILPHDSIDKWTFGIITNGKRLDWMKKIIHSIRIQKIPHYQIIICGNYHDPKEKDISYLPFTKRDDKGWITKKKNLIVQSSRYENICIIHDRVYFDAGWFAGMKKWGNCFDHLSTVQLYKGKRTNDWLLHEELQNVEYSFISNLDYRDWDINVCQGGQMHIAKRTYLLDTPWNEAYLWGRAEDVELSNRLRDKGHIQRMNPYSIIHTLLYKFGEIPTVDFNAQKRSPIRRGHKLRIFLRFVFVHIYSYALLRNFFVAIYLKLHKRNFFK